MLVASCPRGEAAGWKVRSDQKKATYRAYKEAGRYDQCRILLTNSLMALQRAKSTREVGASKACDACVFKQGDDIKVFPTELEDCILELEEQNRPKAERTLYIDYQKKMAD